MRRMCNRVLLISKITAMKEIIRTEAAPAPIGPYNQAVSFNGMVFISGQIAIDAATGELKQGTIQEETQMVMKNLGEVLNASGSGFEQILKVSIFVLDMGLFKEVNEVYSTYFDRDYPARETVEVSGLPKGVRVEISAVAFKQS